MDRWWIAIVLAAHAWAAGSCQAWSKDTGPKTYNGLIMSSRARVSLPRVWNATLQKPLLVSEILEYRHSGPLGLNNVLWAITSAITDGCRDSASLMRKRQSRAVEKGTSTLAVPIVILPPLRKELGFGQKGPMHVYSDIFDLDFQRDIVMKYRNCYISDTTTYLELKETGALVVLQNAEHRKIDGVRKPGGPEVHQMYQGLRLSQRLRDQFYNPCMLKIRNVFHADEKAYMAVHLRVEDDWVGACLIKEAKLAKAGNDPSKKAAQIRKGNAGRSCFGAGQIAEIILNTKGLAQQYRNILLLYAADKSDFTSKIRPKQMRVDPVKVWPDDTAVAHPILLGCFDEGPQRPSYTERSAISMFLAADADVFVGTKLSSLQRGVHLIKGARGDRKPTYLYDGDQFQYRFATLDTSPVYGYRH